MESVTGSLKSLGNSTSSVKVTAYTLIEIGDQLLQNVRISRSLDNFLQRGLSTVEPITIYTVGKRIVGVKLSDGKIYYFAFNSAIPLLLIVVGIPMIAFVGMGFFMIYQGVKQMRWVAAGNALALQGGIAVKY